MAGIISGTVWYKSASEYDFRIKYQIISRQYLLQNFMMLFKYHIVTFFGFTDFYEEGNILSILLNLLHNLLNS